MSFDDVISVQVWHFSTTLDPYLVLAIFSQVIKAGDIESKFATLGELADEQSC
jgi:hypothetical protein